MEQVIPGEQRLTGLIRKIEAIEGHRLAEVDVRLAIAIRSTPYFDRVQDHLIYHPDRDPIYFDRQNYRYQTIRFPGKIRPEQTYKAVNEFYDSYLFSRDHLKYVERMLKRHPDTKPFFQRQYTDIAGEGKALPSAVLEILDFDTAAA